jgi:molybdopterin-guanine dinucleotide biosynthesis protein A
MQVESEPYANSPTIVDSLPRHGPVTGLLSARRIYPGVTWVAAAIDLAMLDDRTVSVLVSRRRATAAATAFLHPDGTVEPLCTIWEPPALAVLAERASNGDFSPRRCLEAVDTKFLACPTPRALISIDSRDEREAVLGEFEAQ